MHEIGVSPEEVGLAPYGWFIEHHNGTLYMDAADYCECIYLFRGGQARVADSTSSLTSMPSTVTTQRAGNCCEEWPHPCFVLTVMLYSPRSLQFVILRILTARWLVHIIFVQNGLLRASSGNWPPWCWAAYQEFEGPRWLRWQSHQSKQPGRRGKGRRGSGW